MNHINGKMDNVIVNMYHNVKSRIMYNNEFFDFLHVGTELDKDISYRLFYFLYTL